MFFVKNYLTKGELKVLERIVTMYLDYAENQAERHILMTMEDLKKRLDIFLQFNKREVLDNSGKVSHKVAEGFALSEFEKYRIIQDKLFESDFDKFIIEMKSENIEDYMYMSSQTYYNWFNKNTNLDNLPVIGNSENWYQLLTFSGTEETENYMHLDLLKAKAINCKNFNYKYSDGANHFYINKEEKIGNLIYTWIEKIKVD